MSSHHTTSTQHVQANPKLQIKDRHSCFQVLYFVLFELLALIAIQTIGLLTLHNRYLIRAFRNCDFLYQGQIQLHHPPILSSLPIDLLINLGSVSLFKQEEVITIIIYESQSVFLLLDLRVDIYTSRTSL